MTKDKDKNSINIFNFSQVKLPEYKTQLYNSLDHVKFGEDNLFPIYLIDMLNRCSLHNAICISKIEQIALCEVQYEDKKLEEYLNTINNDGETFDDIRYKTAFDKVVFGGFYLHLVKRRDGIYNIYHLPFEKMRIDKDKEGFWFSEDWERYRLGVNTPVFYPKFVEGQNEGVILNKDYRAGNYDWYPLPNYVSALSYIQTDTEISNFHLANIKNGMLPSLEIHFTDGKPSVEEQKQTVKKITDKFAGTDNGGKILVTFNEDKDKIPIINPIQQEELDKRFLQLQETVEQNILTGHRITSPMLVGIKTEGQLGGSNEIKQAFELYNNTVIQPLKNSIEKELNKVLKYSGFNEGIVLDTLAPINFTYSENILLSILSKNEMREQIGYEPIEEIITEIKPEI